MSNVAANSQSEHIHHHFVTASPYVSTLDFTGVNGGTADTVTVGGITYTFGTDFFVIYPGVDRNDAGVFVTPILSDAFVKMYAKSVAACINGEVATYDANHVNPVPNIKAYAKNVGNIVVIIGTIEGAALTGLAFTVNGSSGTPTAVFTT